MATIVLGLAGAAIGSSFAGFMGMSGAALGWNIGSLLGGYLFAPKQPTQYGPRLGDLKVQVSTYGNAIPIVYGSVRVAGNCIWSTPKIETAHVSESGGKGGGGGVTQVSYTYSQSFAIAICEGEITGIRKIWANGKLIYNLSDTATVETIIASNKAAAGIRIYTGSETQMPDALIQAYVGAADTPAYRGTAHAVFENMQLLNEWGQQMPNLEFEVIRIGSQAFTVSVGLRYIRETVYGTIFQPNYLSGGIGTIYAHGFLPAEGQFKAKFDAITQLPEETMVIAPEILPQGMGTIRGYSDTPGFPSFSDIPDSSDTGMYWYFDDGSAALLPGVPLHNGLYGHSFCKDGNDVYFAQNYTGSSNIWRGDINGNPAIYSPAANGGYVILGVTSTTLYAWRGSSPYYIEGFDRNTLALTSSVATTASGAVTGFVDSLGNVYTCDGAAVKQINLITGASTLIFDGPSGIKSLRKLNDNLWIYGRPNNSSGYCDIGYAYRTITKSSTVLSTIVSEICLRAGLTAGQIDVTQLTDTVDGYVVQRGTARSWLEPLMQAYYFDAVESDGKIKFVKRGGAASVAIPEADLAAHEYGTQLPDNLITTRKQEMELPVECNVQYMDTSAAYQIGSQASRRLTTDSENKISVNLPISMTGTKGKQIADVLMYEAWTSRMVFDFQTSWKYARLEPTDVVTVTKGNRTYTLRLVDEDASGGVYRRQAVLEDASIYTQSATAAPITVADDTVSSVPLTDMVLMDIPLLRDQDDGVGFYAAACGYADGWYGAQAFKSNDGGATWTSFGPGLLNEATIGSASTVLGDFHSGNIFDELNSVTVVLTNGTLSSDTETNVLNGAKVYLLGNEILQAKNAVLTAPMTYVLSGLLRGRRGTEFGMATHAVGERFVELTSTTTYLFTGTSDEYDLVRKYRGVSFGGFLDDAATVTFTNTAASLMPYSPTHLGGGRNAALDVILTWIRRTRIGGAWNNYSDVPLGEASEAYEVEIWDSGYTVLKRTITGISSETMTYTAAQQTTDFGGTQATVYFKVFQVSAVVGRGFEARGTV